MAVAIGQVTIMDFNDAITLSGWISANKSKSVTYFGDSDQYLPDYGVSSLILTPSLFKAGSTTDILDGGAGANVISLNWYRKTNNDTTRQPLGGSETVGASYPKALTVAANPFSTTIYNIEYICEIVYRDPRSNLDITYMMSFSIDKVTQGSNVAIADITSDPSNIFKNGEPSSITLTAKLTRGTTVDKSDLTYVWYKLGATGYEVIAGQTLEDLVVSKDDVANMGSYKVKITDSGKNDNYTSDAYTVMDFSDPIKVDIANDGPLVFKNGEGSTDLTAKLFRNGEEIDVAGTEYAYAWQKIDSAGVSTTYGTTKTVSVGTVNVSGTASFVCTVSEK